MDCPTHDLPELFRQLGLPDTAEAIDAFVARHRSLANGLDLARAPFWSSAQRSFLASAIADDADWCGAADLLSARLR